MVETCRACDGGPLPERIDGREMMLGLREHFTYRRCSRCRSLWLEEPPADLARYYPSNYYSLRVIPAQTDWWSRARARVAVRLPAAIVERASSLPGLRGTPQFARWLAGLGVKPTDKVGDLGCGSGTLLREMAACGFSDLWGFDPYLEHDMDVEGVHLRSTDIQGVPFGFDVLLCNHTLEHLANPVVDLIAARNRLRAGAAFVIRVPLADSFAERTYEENWLQLDAPRHLWIPSEEGVRILASRAGFEIKRVFYDGLALALYGSELYKQDVALAEFGSRLSGEGAGFTAEELATYRSLATRLNRQHDGDAAGFVLRPSALD